ncbi:MAG TPA: OmpA family protein [Polyangia bacterium]|nr:OmpA family protein [Polyangia bacterium]
MAGVRSAAAEKSGGGPPLRMMVDRAKVDLQQHRLEVVVSHPVPKVSIKVTGESGAVLADEEQDLSGRPPGAPTMISWHPSSDEPVEQIDIHAADARGFAFDITLTPYSVSIPHDEVTFRTDSAEIDASEVPKLEAAFETLSRRLASVRGKGIPHGNLALYIVGRTDTVGGAVHNLKLSQDRARSIAQWFRVKGVPLPIAYDGLGKASVQVGTGDQVAERQNRRVDYFLSDGEPTLNVAGARPTWKRLR